MVEIKIARVPGLADWWSDPKPSNDCFPSWIKDLRKEKLVDNKLNVSDCLPAIEAMLQGIIIEFPVTMTFEYLGNHPKLGKMIACDHKGYPIIGGHEFSQYKGAEFQDLHVVKVGLPWVIEVPKGYSCLFTAPFNRSGNAEAFCISGVVRCDRYYNMVSVPFAIPLKKKGDVVSVERGRPFVQIIPVKRENVELTFSQIDMKNLETTVNQIDENPGYYKTMAKEQNK
jgi:hypothetical protein|tara:strand:- start:104 stop:784 length:681 start_codon:yes stop_codon:yes gene_type:complete